MVRQFPLDGSVTFLWTGWYRVKTRKTGPHTRTVPFITKRLVIW